MYIPCSVKLSVQQPWYIVSKANRLPNTLVIIPDNHAHTLAVLWCYQPRLTEVSGSVSTSNFWFHWIIFVHNAWLGCNQGDNWHALNCDFHLTLYQGDIHVDVATDFWLLCLPSYVFFHCLLVYSLYFSMALLSLLVCIDIDVTIESDCS